jgi:hypothetical protein
MSHEERRCSCHTVWQTCNTPPAYCVTQGGRMSHEQRRCHCRTRGKPSTPLCIANCIGYKLPPYGGGSSLSQVKIMNLPRKRDWRLRASKVCRGVKEKQQVALNPGVHAGKQWAQKLLSYKSELTKLARLASSDGLNRAKVCCRVLWKRNEIEWDNWRFRVCWSWGVVRSLKATHSPPRVLCCAVLCCAVFRDRVF